jgi:hypothetical protein
MAGQGPAINRLRGFLRDLKPEARAKLIGELERGMLDGKDVPGADIILAELRRSFRDTSPKTLRFGDPARLFFEPLEPFLVEDTLDHKHRGRIAVAALQPFWLWLTHTLMPEDVSAYSEKVEDALLANDNDCAEQLARAFQDRALHVLRQALAILQKDDKERRKIAMQIGTPHAIQDISTVGAILGQRDGLAMLDAQLPGIINNFSGSTFDEVKALVDTPFVAKSELFLYALVLVMSRLAAPWSLIRLATKAAGSDIAARVAETPYAVAVDVVLDEVERQVRELTTNLKSGRGVAVAALLKDIRDAVRGLRSELDLPVESPWGKQLAAIRSEISKVLTAEIELMPGRVRRLMRPRPSREIAPGATLNIDEIEEAQALVGLVVACRNFAGELAISEVTQRTFTDLQKLLDTGTRTLLDALRLASAEDRPFRQSQVDAAVRFCAKVFGPEYAAAMARAAEVASQGPPKTGANVVPGERKVAVGG